MKAQRRNTLVVVVTAMVAWASCDPAVIAPLPSPVRPDDDKITTSSLGLTVDESQDHLIAVVGLPGAIAEIGAVRVSNLRTGVDGSFPVTDAGSFSATLFGKPGDVLELIYVDPVLRESEPLEIVVGTYEPPEKTNDQGAPDPVESEAPAVPGGEFGYSDGGATDCEGEGEDCPGPPVTGSGDDDRLALVWAFDGTTLHIEGGEGFTSADAFVVVSNHDTGAAAVVQATAKGAALIDIAASAGDQIILFAQSSTNPNLTSPTITFRVPDAGGSDGTGTPATP